MISKIFLLKFCETLRRSLENNDERKEARSSDPSARRGEAKRYSASEFAEGSGARTIVFLNDEHSNSPAGEYARLGKFEKKKF